MTLRQLREAVDCLPRATRLAMLEGISRNSIIVGAYAEHSGICPMLAAHRAGGRTSFIGFAKAWDAYAFRGSRRHTPRPATERELLVLRTHLEASLLEDECPDLDLRAAAAEHRDLQARRAAADQTLERHPGGHWMRVVRSLEDYEQTLRELKLQVPGAEEDARSAPSGVLAAYA